MFLPKEIFVIELALAVFGRGRVDFFILADFSTRPFCFMMVEPRSESGEPGRDKALSTESPEPDKTRKIKNRNYC